MSPCCLAPRAAGPANSDLEKVVAGTPQPDALAKWAANAPLAFVDQSVGNLRTYRAIAMDVGDQDRLRDDAVKLHEALDKYGIANTLEGCR